MERAVTRLPWALALLAIAATIGTWVLVVANRPVLTSMAQASLIEGVVPLGFAVAGGLVASRLPSNPVGRLLLATAVLVALSGVVRNSPCTARWYVLDRYRAFPGSHGWRTGSARPCSRAASFRSCSCYSRAGASCRRAGGPWPGGPSSPALPSRW